MISYPICRSQRAAGSNLRAHWILGMRGSRFVYTLKSHGTLSRDYNPPRQFRIFLVQSSTHLYSYPRYLRYTLDSQEACMKPFLGFHLLTTLHLKIWFKIEINNFLTLDICTNVHITIILFYICNCLTYKFTSRWKMFSRMWRHNLFLEFLHI